MDRHLIVEDDAEILADLPQQDILADIAAGLDDLQHGRTVPVEVVLASLDAKITAWRAKKAMLNQDGENRPHRSASN